MAEEAMLIKRRPRNRDKGAYRFFLYCDGVSLFVYFWLIVAKVITPNWLQATLGFVGLLAVGGFLIWLLKGESEPVQPEATALPQPDDEDKPRGNGPTRMTSKTMSS